MPLAIAAGMSYRVDLVTTLPPHREHCYACAGILDVRAEVCGRCGIRQPELPVMTPPEVVRATVAATRHSRPLAIVLALLLGGFGLHKAYLGRVRTATIYAVFCWTFIPALLAIFDAFALMALSDEDFAKHYPD